MKLHAYGRHTSSSALQQASHEVLLLCTTANISSKSQERLSRILAEGLDWEYLLKQAHFHGVVPLVTHNLVTDGFRNLIPQPYLDHLNRSYHHTLFKNVIFSTEMAKVLSAFNQHSISAIPLKGTVLAEILYGNPALREMWDTDILVHPADVPRANSVLVELGYKQLNITPMRKHPFHEFPYCKQAQFSIYLELHHDLDDRVLVSVPEQEIWHRARPLQLQGMSTLVLSPEDNLLFLSTHLCKQNAELLKYIGDISELLKKYEATLDWDYTVASAHSWQVESAAYYALTRARDLLGAPVPASVLDTLKPGLWRRWLIGFLVSQTNLVKPIKGNKLRDWTMVLARCLMMKHTRQMLVVLSRQQGSGKKGTWLRTAGWIMLVFIAGLGRNIGMFSRKKLLKGPVVTF